MNKASKPNRKSHYITVKGEITVPSNLLLQFSQNLFYVGLVGQSDHNIQLLQLHVDWIIILDKEDLQILFQHIWSAAYNR